MCEIDIIARRDGVIYFTEVKYRAAAFQGDGFEYITAAKQSRMKFAAEIWRQTYGYEGDFRLLAAAVSGMDCEDLELVEL